MMWTEPLAGSMVGPYRVVGRLGAGGMGVVLAAHDTTLDRPVALKLISGAMADVPEFRRRFRTEARLMAGVDSPHIPAVYGFGEHAGGLYIATQLVTGGDLQARLHTDGALGLGDVCILADQVAEALAAAHAVGVLHRDLKPSNVLLRGGSRLFAYLSDFGIATDNTESLTRTGAFVGSLAYAAPERCEGSPATPASDQYALGCLAFTALAGGPPFRGSDLEVARQHVGAPVPLEELPPAPPWFIEFVRRTTAKNPADRYASMSEARGALRAADATAPARVDHGERTRRRETAPVGVGPSGSATTLRRTQSLQPRPSHGSPGGHRRLLAVVVAVALVVMVGTSVVLVYRAADPGRVPSAQRNTHVLSSPSAGGPALSADAAPTGQATPADVHQNCWTTPATDGGCPPVTGIAGLKWVFPTYAGASAGCVSASLQGVKALARRCTMVLDDGGRTTVWYSEFARASDVVPHYTPKLGAPATGSGQITFGPTRRDDKGGVYQAAYAYTGLRWSLVIEASTPHEVRSAREHVRMRPRAQIVAQPR